MIAGVCGFGNTGSSAVSDFLKEFPSVSVPDIVEFTIICEPDGLCDLAEHVTRPRVRNLDSVVAIDRYSQKLKEFAQKCGDRGADKKAVLASGRGFLEAITLEKWFWRDRSGKQTGFFNEVVKRKLLLRRFVPWAEALTGKPFKAWPRKQVSMSVMQDGFYALARQHVKELIEAMGGDLSRLVVLDQPAGGNCPEACFPFLEDPAAIVCDRDPRDLYVFAREKMKSAAAYMPLETPGAFINYYRAIRQSRHCHSEDRVLKVRFEDMVYRYEETAGRITDFLGLGQNPAPKTIFDPAKSVYNTRVFERFPKYADAVRQIEAELPEYLFDFSPYPAPGPSGAMFSGRTGRSV